MMFCSCNLLSSRPVPQSAGGTRVYDSDRSVGDLVNQILKSDKLLKLLNVFLQVNTTQPYALLLHFLPVAK